MNIHASLAEPSQPRFLMCPPHYFAVTYSINPWMDPKAWAESGAALHASAQRQWDGLRRALALAGAAIEILPPRPGLPDLVFTANAAVVLGGKAVLARFRHLERQKEEPLFAAGFAALAARGLIADIVQLPAGLKFEGAGDCIFDARRGLFWLGCGFRSDAAAGRVIARQLRRALRGAAIGGCEFLSPRHRVLRAALRAVVYYPGAFTLPALARIHDLVAPAERIVLDRADAERFAANAVCVGRSIVLSSASAALRRALERRGYRVIETPLDVFQKSGGSACCLTLRLDHRLAPASADVRAAAAPTAAAKARRRWATDSASPPGEAVFWE